MIFQPFNDLSIYEHVAHLYAMRVMKHPMALAVYQLGTVNEPGVSDLDMLVVVKSDCTDINDMSAKNILKDEPQLLAVFLHDVAVFDMQGFKDLPYIYYLSRLQHLAGEEIPIELKQNQLSSEVHLANLIEFSLPRVHRLGQFQQKKISPRKMVLLALAYIHTVTLAEKIGIVSQENVKFINRAIALRKEVKTGVSEEHILKFCNDARIMFAKSLNAAANTLPVQKEAPRIAILCDYNRRAITLFGNCSENKDLCGNTPFGIPDTTWLLASEGLYWYFHCYAKMNGLLGDSAKRALTPSCKENGLADDFRSFLEDRSIKLNRRVIFLRKVKGEYSDIMPRPGFMIR